jgi:nucleotide-binding universal stress UspA family protein
VRDAGEIGCRRPSRSRYHAVVAPIPDATEELVMVPKFETILMPTDFSPAADHALEYAVLLARQSGASIHLLYVVAFPVEVTAWPEAYWVELGGLRDQLRADAERELAARAAGISGVEVSTEVKDGSPARTIVDCAVARRCQLIVMGTHGRGGLGHLVLGSVAERVVRTASCPVLTVSAAAAQTQQPAATKAKKAKQTR